MKTIFAFLLSILGTVFFSALFVASFFVAAVLVDTHSAWSLVAIAVMGVSFFCAFGCINGSHKKNAKSVSTPIIENPLTGADKAHVA